jgi:hypothetical protein
MLERFKFIEHHYFCCRNIIIFRRAVEHDIRVRDSGDDAQPWLGNHLLFDSRRLGDRCLRIERSCANGSIQLVSLGWPDGNFRKCRAVVNQLRDFNTPGSRSSGGQ